MRHSVVHTAPHTPDQLFALVGDVARYPEFVPWITSMSVSPARRMNETTDTVDAHAGVGFSFLKERFSTRVIRNSQDHTIAVELIRGPFHHLINRWRFSPCPAGTKIEFQIDFRFKSRVLDKLLATNFDRAVDKLMQCFDDRATALYGRAKVGVGR